MPEIVSLKPKEALVWSINSDVVVKLKGGRFIRGKLRGFDVHLNLTLNNAQQILENGDLRSLGDIIVRGDVVVFIVFPSLQYKGGEKAR